MELGTAIKLLIQQEGIKILDHQMLVNHLMDMQAFEDLLPSRYLIKMLQNEGCFKQLYSLASSNKEMQPYWDVLCSEMRTRWGFRDDVVKYVTSQIAIALGLNVTLASPNSHANNQPQPQIKKTGKHFCFKDVEICGSVQDVVSQLMQQGYKLLEQQDDFALLGGSFAGVLDCQILVTASEFINEVYSISVLLPESQNWWGLKADYDKFKTKLTSKYGLPKVMEFFNDPYYEGDGYEITAFETGNALYSSEFSLDKGSIRVAITSQRVFLIYTDSKNEKLIERAQDSIADIDL